MRRTILSLATLASLVAFAGSNASASPTSKAAERWLLDDAPVQTVLRPALVVEVFELLEAVASKQPQGKRAFGKLRYKLARGLKLTRFSAKGLAAIGVDPAQPGWVSFGAHDAKPIIKLHRMIRRGLGRLRASKGDKARAAVLKRLEAEATSSPAAVRARLVLPVRDAAKLGSYLARVMPPWPAKEVARIKRLKPWAKPQAARLLARELDQLAGPAGRVVAFGLAKPPTWILARFVGAPPRQLLVVDAVQRWVETREPIDEAGAQRLLGFFARKVAGARPRRKAAERAKLAVLRRKALDPQAGMGILLEGRALQDLAALQVERDVFQAIARQGGPSKAMIAEAQRSVSRCLGLWRGARAVTGDAALRISLTKRSWHARAWWSLPRRVERAIKRSVVKAPELIDPTAFTSTLALAGTRVDLTRLAQSYGRGIFSQRARRFGDALDECQPVSGVALASGGWLGILGVALAEVRATPLLAPMAPQLRAVVSLLRSLPATRRFGRFSYQQPGSAVVHFELKAGARARAKVEIMAAKASIKPRSRTSHGRKTAVYTGVKGLGKAALGLTPLEKGRLAVTLGQRARDVRWFLSQKPPTKAILPRSILAFGHVNLPALLSHAASRIPVVARQTVGPMLAALADQIGRLGFNLGLDGDLLAAEIRIDRK